MKTGSIQTEMSLITEASEYINQFLKSHKKIIQPKPSGLSYDFITGCHLAGSQLKKALIEFNELNELCNYIGSIPLINFTDEWYNTIEKALFCIENALLNGSKKELKEVLDLYPE